MLKKILLLLSIALPLAFFVASCGDDDDPNTCDTTSVTYTNSVAAILNSSCATATACHGSGAVNGSLANYNDAVAFAAFGRIGGAINHDNGFSPMPYPEGSAKLSDCNIDKIEAWIAAGTPE